MAVLLSFPDDEAKARRRGFARARAEAARDERIVEGWRVRLADMIGTRPKGGGDTPALDLARWVSDAHALLQDVKAQPAQIRSEVHVAGLCLKLKGLVDEAEHARFLLVERALDSGAPGARRAPVAALTANLVSDPLAGAVSSAGSSVAGPAVAPSTACGPAIAASPDLVGGLVGVLVSDNLRLPAADASSPAAGGVKRPGGAIAPGRLTARGGCEEDRETGEGCFEAALPARVGGWPVSFLLTCFWGVFHALTMRLFRRAVSEKGNRGFSGGEGRS